MKKVAIVDYGMGNVDSVARAVQHSGGEPIITNEADAFKEVNYIILPGVGSFHIGMKNIRAVGLEEVLTEQVLNIGVPFLGICLGMQLLATKGWEGEETNGLGWIKGEVKRFIPDSPQARIPHVGWNEVFFDHDLSIFQDIPSGKDFYFVHSYHFLAVNANEAIAHTPYCGQFTSIVAKNNIIGVQFHPEKSQKIGLKLIKNFLKV